jgi:hypothetical protein
MVVEPTRNPRLSQTWGELHEAQEALVRLGRANGLNECSRAWRDFLSSVDRTWNKACAGTELSKRWYDKWRQPILKAIDSDPLLQYLAQARNAREHTILELLGETVGLNVRIHVSGPISGIRFDRDGIHVQGAPAAIQAHTMVCCVPIVDERSKKLYVPPTSHMGSPVQNDAVQIGTLAVTYWSGALERAEQYFRDRKL